MSPGDEAEIIYTGENYRALMTELKSLSSFAAIADWVARARAELATVISVIRQLEAELARQKQILEDAQKARAQKSMIRRMFGGDKAEKVARRQVEQCKQGIRHNRAIATELQGRIDTSPSSPEEQNALLKELRLRRRELLLQKEEATTTMKSIPEEARRQSAVSGRGRWASLARLDIRYPREVRLLPDENKRQAIERQLLQIERDIRWVEKLTE